MKKRIESYFCSLRLARDDEKCGGRENEFFEVGRRRTLCVVDATESCFFCTLCSRFLRREASARRALVDAVPIPGKLRTLYSYEGVVFGRNSLT